MKLFMKRHVNLSLRKPENISLARTTGFNKTSVKEFQENFKHVYVNYKFTPENIYKYNETGMALVQAPNVVSNERGSLVSMLSVITASGSTIPPVYIFPRARVHDSQMTVDWFQGVQALLIVQVMGG